MVDAERHIYDLVLASARVWSIVQPEHINLIADLFYRNSFFENVCKNDTVLALTVYSPN